MMFNDYLVLPLYFCIGLCVGSFINALEFRLHRGESNIRNTHGGAARSRCPQCQATLAARDLIPVYSFIVLRGRCRYCAQPISWQYPLVECIGAILFIATALMMGPLNPAAFVVTGYGAILLFLFIYDLKYQLLPDRVMIPGIVVAVLASGVVLDYTMMNMVWGAVVAGGFFLLQYLISRGRWIGAGDIRFGVLMGAMLGFQKTIAALFIAYIGGAVVSLLLLAIRRVRRDTRIPFGTFLAVATLFCLWWGDALIDWYMHLLI
ncbi:MAG: prepilin peptidase [Candidatus Kerfeldbacteria bacterium]|nr:prepilin peptidase [Candidatus Kerfeldbacteria bacterium]